LIDGLLRKVDLGTVLGRLKEGLLRKVDEEG
jgi:hypothetical protein